MSDVCHVPEACSLQRISLHAVLRSDIVWNVKKYVALQRQTVMSTPNRAEINYILADFRALFYFDVLCNLLTRS